MMLGKVLAVLYASARTPRLPIEAASAVVLSTPVTREMIVPAAMTELDRRTPASSVGSPAGPIALPGVTAVTSPAPAPTPPILGDVPLARLGRCARPGRSRAGRTRRRRPAAPPRRSR